MVKPLALTPRQKERLSQTLLQLADQRLSEAFYAVAAEYTEEDGYPALRLYVEHQDKAGLGRVNLEACAAISRELDEAVEALPELGGLSYCFEVSSPGLFRTLTSERELAFYVGWPVEVTEGGEPVADLPLVKGILKSYNPVLGQAVLQDEGDGSLSFTVDLKQNLSWQLRLAPPVEWPNDEG